MVHDIIIVGAGIAGASLAYRLPPERQVLMLEREARPGYHSTGRSAALFLEIYGSETVRALTMAGRDFLQQPPEGFCPVPILTPRGMMFVGGPEDLALLQRDFADFRAQGIDVRWLAPDEAQALVPCLDAACLAGAIYDPHACDIDVDALHQAYIRGARQHGVSLQLDAGVARATRGEDGLWTLVLDDGATLRTRTVVNAAGAWADDLAQRCGVRPLGIQPRRRSAFLFSPPEGVDHTGWPAVLDVGNRYYFKPDAGMLVGSPSNADPVAAHDVVAEEIDIATGIHHIEAVSSLRIRRPSHVWAGLRSFAPDEEMVIGWDADVPGFFWLAGQGGYGIQTSAGVSLLAASQLAGAPLPQQLARFGVQAAVMAPGRFA